MNQPVGHMVRISTNEKPAPARWVSSARNSALRVRATVPAEFTALPHGNRQYTEDLVAVDFGAGMIDGQAPVGVAIVRDAQVGAVLNDRALQHPEMGRPIAVVDVEPVGLGPDDVDLGARRAERLGRHLRGGTVCGIDDDLEPFEPVGKAAKQMRDVAGAAVLQ